MFFEFILSLLIVFLIYRILMAFSSVESVLLLILLAINFSMLLFFYGINFLAILYLAVYIGAVTVFFLFVVMMTDIGSSAFNNNFKLESIGLVNGYKRKLIYLSCISILGYYISNFFVIVLNFSEFDNNMFTNLRNIFFVNSYFDQFNVNIELIGFSIFNEHAGPFIISSLVILIALIGSIFITTLVNEESTDTLFSFYTPTLANIQLVENNSKSQDMEIQLVRQFLNSIYLNLSK